MLLSFLALRGFVPFFLSYDVGVGVGDGVGDGDGDGDGVVGV